MILPSEEGESRVIETMNWFNGLGEQGKQIFVRNLISQRFKRYVDKKSSGENLGLISFIEGNRSYLVTKIDPSTMTELRRFCKNNRI